MSDRLVFLDGAPAQVDGEALKVRGAEALERALAFAESHGDEIARCRARVAVRVAEPDRLGEAVEARQAGDGSCAPFDVSASGWIGRLLRDAGVDEPLQGAIEALALLGDAELLHRPGAERAVRYLESRQHTDGSFGAAGGGVDALVPVTGLACGLLARTLFARPEGIASGGGYLGELWSPDRIEGGRWADLVAYAIFHTNAPDDQSDETLQWCGRELEKGFRSQRSEALTVLQTLLVCQVGSIPGASFAPEELLGRLLDEQAADGGFDALCAEGPRARVGPTIDAMRSIIGVCATF